MLYCLISSAMLWQVCLPRASGLVEGSADGWGPAAFGQIHLFPTHLQLPQYRMTACPPWTPCHTQTSYLESHPWTKDIKGSQGDMAAALGQGLATNRYSKKSEWRKETNECEKRPGRKWNSGAGFLACGSYSPPDPVSHPHPQTSLC